MDTNDHVINQALSALRLTSKEIAAASDATRVNITVRFSDLQHTAPCLSKLTALTALGIRATPEEKSPLTDLAQLSKHVPHLDSLTLCSGQFASMEVHNIPELLLPLRHTLRHLKLHRCTLTMDMGPDSVASRQMVSGSPTSHIACTQPWICHNSGPGQLLGLDYIRSDRLLIVAPTQRSVRSTLPQQDFSCIQMPSRCHSHIRLQRAGGLLSQILRRSCKLGFPRLWRIARPGIQLHAQP